MTDIRPFILSDLGKFLPNEFSSPDVALEHLVDPTRWCKTLHGDDGFVQAISCLHNYQGCCWDGFFLVAETMDVHTPMILKQELKRFMVEKNALRLQTLSQANKQLREWHEWLGFTHEGTRRKMLFERDYDMWAIVREEG